MKTPTKHISLSMPMTIYEEIKAVADESEISVTKAVNSIIRGYLKAREARRKRDELND
jgi:metal-responsive CopG/Arc/MetJ family transcriptional regulator